MHWCSLKYINLPMKEKPDRKMTLSEFKDYFYWYLIASKILLLLFDSRPAACGRCPKYSNPYTHQIPNMYETKW